MNYETQKELTDAEAEFFAQDFKLSDADQKRVCSKLEELHTLCKELQIPLLAAVVLGKTESSEGTSVENKLAAYQPGERVPNYMHTALHILQDGIDIPCGLLKVFSALSNAETEEITS
jgi:hypothetical protein